MDSASYLAALIDGEGCVGLYTVKGDKYSGGKLTIRTITIGVTDKEIIDCAANCFDELNIKYNRIVRSRSNGHKTMHIIEVHAYDGLKKALELIPIQHIAKKGKLLKAVSSFKEKKCSNCGIDYDKRTIGCWTCIGRHKIRRRNERKGTSSQLRSMLGIRGRPPRYNAPILDESIKNECFNRKPKLCIVCNKEFTSYSDYRVKTCSRECFTQLCINRPRNPIGMWR